MTKFQIDTVWGEKHPFRTETKYIFKGPRVDKV